MGYKWQGHKTFDMGNGYAVACKWQRTSYGFRHVVELFKDGEVISTGKGCYYNRTWEKYTYQSAIQNAIYRSKLPKHEKEYLFTWAAEGKEPLKQEMAIFGTTAMTALLGDVLCDTQEQKNSWKKRMINTIPGIEFPDGFDQLPEDRKEQILDGVIKVMKDD